MSDVELLPISHIEEVDSVPFPGGVVLTLDPRERERER